MYEGGEASQRVFAAFYHHVKFLDLPVSEGIHQKLLDSVLSDVFFFVVNI